MLGCQKWPQSLNQTGLPLQLLSRPEKKRPTNSEEEEQRALLELNALMVEIDSFWCSACTSPIFYSVTVGVQQGRFR